MLLRRLSRIATATLASLVLGVLANVHAEERTWKLLRNPYFRALTDADEKRARTLLEEMDRFRIVVQEVSNSTLPQDAPPVTVIMFANREEFGAYSPSRGYAGYVLPSVKGLPDNTAVVWASGAGADEFQVIRHEYVHILNRYRLISFPKWYEEGIAEVFSMISIDGTKVTVGLPPADRFKVIDQYQSAGIDAWTSFDDLVSGKFIAHANLYVGAYAQYWLLAHYLTYGRPDLKKELDLCLILSDGMMKPLDAFRTAFGMTPDQMWSKELRPYGRKVPAQVFSFRKPILAEPFETSPAPADEVTATLSALKGYIDEVRAEAAER